PFELGSDWSQQTSTSALNTKTLPARLQQLATWVEESDRTSPLETCFVRTTTRWLADPSQAVAELGIFQDAGLDWLELKVYGRTHAARLESIAAFAELIRSHGFRG